MTIREIAERVALNTGESISDTFISIIKRSINDVYSAVSLKVEDFRTTDMFTVVDSQSDHKLPADCFLVNEVKFIPSSAFYVPQEVTIEEFTRHYAEATGNRLYYCVQHQNDGVTLKWFPSFNGSILTNYSVIPKFLDAASTENTEVVYPNAFYLLLVYGCTHRYLLIKMHSVSTEIDLYKTKALIEMYKGYYDDALKDYAVFNRKTISTPIIQHFDFSDDSMLRI